MDDRAEIRLLGRFHVRAADGTVVQHDAWRTGKAMDLLRLLAVDANRPQPATSLIGKLWPDAEPERGRASLRTAASQVRRLLGSQTIERHLGGVMLCGAWIDVIEYRTLADEVHVAHRRGDHLRAVQAARAAEALYIGDFFAYDDDSPWATEVRESLRLRRRSILGEAAESAVELLCMRDAIEFATTMVGIDPSSERAHRVLMYAHASLGEIELALRAYDHGRTMLDRELGVEPSAQTRAMFKQLLADSLVDDHPITFAARPDELDALHRTLTRAMSSPVLDLVCVVGRPGSGREALAHAAAERVEGANVRTLLDMESEPASLAHLRHVIGDDERDLAIVGHFDTDARWEATRIRSMAHGLAGRVPRVIVVLTSVEACQWLAEEFDADASVRVHRSVCRDLDEDGLREVLTATLSSEPSADLIAAAAAQCDGLAGRCVALVRHWVDSGRIVATSRGLGLVPREEAVFDAVESARHVRLVLEKADPVGLEMAYSIALSGRPVRVEELKAWCPDQRTWTVHEVESELDHLIDFGVLRLTAEGYECRSQTLMDAIEAWLRPAVRARLSRRVVAFGRSGRGRRPWPPGSTVELMPGAG